MAAFRFFEVELARSLGKLRYSECDIRAMEPVEYMGFISDWKAGIL